MNIFLGNLLLALTWTVVTGQFTLTNLLFGFGLGYCVLWLARPAIGQTSYFRKMPQILQFGLHYLWDVIHSNLRLAYDIVTPRHHMRPGVIAVPLDARTDWEITVLANLITFTPGTLSLDVSPCGRVLYVHAVYLDDGDLEAARRRIKEGLERRVLEVLR